MSEDTVDLLLSEIEHVTLRKQRDEVRNNIEMDELASKLMATALYVQAVVDMFVTFETAKRPIWRMNQLAMRRLLEGHAFFAAWHADWDDWRGHTTTLTADQKNRRFLCPAITWRQNQITVMGTVLFAQERFAEGRNTHSHKHALTHSTLPHVCTFRQVLVSPPLESECFGGFVWSVERSPPTPHI